MSTSETRPNHRAVLTVCLGMTFGMLGMAYAAVPLYAWFCQVTGYAGTTQRADATTGDVLAKTITVRFDANVSNDLDWEFTPAQRSQSLKIGEKAQAFYIAKNTGKSASFGTATFNVSPGLAGAYFNKIECFCFTEQVLKAGEQVEMPVVYFIDPEIVNDPLLKDTTTITLSYTFFPDEESEQKVTENSSKNSPKITDGEKSKTSL